MNWFMFNLCAVNLDNVLCVSNEECKLKIYCRDSHTIDVNFDNNELRDKAYKKFCDYIRK